MRLNGIPIEDEDLAQRIKIVREICIPHKRFAELDKLIHVSRLTGQGIAILGETGAGKSTLFKKYEAKYPRYIKRKVIKGHECDTTIIPILRVELDSNSSPLNVASKMLECIGDDRYFEGREKVLTSRLKGYIVDAEVELIIIDELQHLVSTETHTVIHKAADWLKQLLNDINVPIVFGGIRSDALKIFKGNQQLDERFPNKPSFHGFPFKEQQDQKEFRGFLKAFDKNMPIAERSKVSEPYLAEKIYYATRGIPRTIRNLFIYSLTEAFKLGHDKLEEIHLFEGFKCLNLETRPKVVNPFHGKAFDLKIAFEKEG